MSTFRLAINVGLNLLGQALPLVAAVALLPPLLRGLGVERFGLLAVIWMVVGYFTLFDLGLSRAVARQAAESLGSGQEAQIPSAFWSSTALMAIISILAAGACALAVPALITDVFRLDGDIASEARGAFYVACVSIPVVVLSGMLRGLLEAKQMFGIITLIRVPSSVWTFLGPAALLPFSVTLPPIAVVLLVGRLFAFVALVGSVWRAYPDISVVRIEGRILSGLLTTGVWMTMSSLLAPLMLTADRILIASIVSVAAVAFYATPYEAVTRLWILTGALTTVLFPAFATISVLDSTRLRDLYVQAVRYLLVILTPVIAVAVGLAHELLRSWLGTEFADVSTRPMQLLAIGVLFSSFSLIPFTLLQATRRPALPALLQLAELPVYLLAAVWLIEHAGITGAAMAWTGRIVIDAIALALIAGNQLRLGWRALWPFVTSLIVPLMFVPSSLQWAGTSVAVVVTMWIAWVAVLSNDEKESIRRRLRLRRTTSAGLA